MLKKVFNLSALAGSWVLAGALSFDLGTNMLADPVTSHTLSTAHLRHVSAALNAPFRTDISSYRLREIDLRPYAPSCEPVQRDNALCAWLAFDAARMERKEPYGARSAGAQAHYDHARAYEPSAAYKTWDATRAEKTIDAITSDAFIRENFERVKRPFFYGNTAEAQEQAALKQALLQRASDIMRETYGLPPVPVALYRFGMNRYNTAGYYVPEQSIIAVNYEAVLGGTVSFGAMLDTILHETRHSIDADYGRMLLSGQMARDDIRAGHATAILLNRKEYIPAGSDSGISSGSWNPLYEPYHYQYIERTAFATGHSLAGRIISRLYCDSLSRAPSCGMEKLRQSLNF